MGLQPRAERGIVPLVVALFVEEQQAVHRNTVSLGKQFFQNLFLTRILREELEQ